MLKLDLTNSTKELKKLHAKKIFLQIPEGLKTKTEGIVEELEGKGFEVLIEMDSCFGACDVKPSEAKKMGCDAILHLGHTKFLEKSPIPIVYTPLKYELGERFERIVEIISERLIDEGEKEVGIVTTAQFLDYLPELKEKLEEKGIKVQLGKGKRVENGQVLGCNYSSARVKAPTIVYLGDGLFHPLGIHYATQKKVIIANPLMLEIKNLEEEKETFLRKRIMMIERAKNANEFAILVSTKEGQNRITEAKAIKKELEKAGKKAKIYLMDFISQEALLGINATAFVNTACPRIAIDDYASYKQPIINYPEVEYLLGKKKYEKYEVKEIY